MATNLAYTLENDLYKIRGMVSLCMESLGNHGSSDDVETTLWAAYDLLNKVNEQYQELLQQHATEREELERQNMRDAWSDIDEIVEEFTSEWDDDGEVELAVQDGSGEGTYDAIFQEVISRKAPTRARMKKGKKK